MKQCAIAIRGATSKSDMISSLEIQPGSNMLLATKKLAEKKVKEAAVRISLKYGQRRRELRAETTSIIDQGCLPGWILWIILQAR